MARPRKIENVFNPPKSNRQFSEGQKSKGILDDFPIRTNIDTTEGTIQDLPVDEKDIANKQYVDSVAGRSSIDLFISENASDIATYFDLEADVDITAEQNIVQSITANSTTLIGSFASVLAEPEIDAIQLLESGIYEMHIHAKGAAARNLFIYYEFYKRAAGGTETLLGTSHDSGELTTTDTNYALHANITTDTAWIAGDRVVVKIYGRNDGSAAKDVTIYMEGTTAARVVFPGVIPFDNAGGDFSDGGEAGGANRTLGNTDSYNLGFITNGSTRLTLDTQGEVGIGTTNPDEDLHIYSTFPFIRLETSRSNNTGNTGLTFFENGTKNWSIVSKGSDNTFKITSGAFETTRFIIEPGGNIGIGTGTPAASAKVDITSTTGALLVPRMTTTQRNALTAVNGMIIYNSTTNAFNYYVNSGWSGWP